MATSEQLQTPAWLVGTFKGLLARFHEISSQHSMNNAALIAQKARADQIADPAARAKILEKIRADVWRQGVIADAGRSFYSSLIGARNNLVAALNTIGVSTSELRGLAGVGALPLIPIAIGLGLVALSVFAASLWSATQTQARAVAANTSIIDKVLAGELSVDDGARLIDANSKAANNSKDMLGIQAALSALTPIVGLVVVAIILPGLLRTIGGARSSAAA